MIPGFRVKFFFPDRNQTGGRPLPTSLAVDAGVAYSLESPMPSGRMANMASASGRQGES